MSIFKTGYYKLNKIELMMCGAWPQQSPIVAYTIRVFVILLLTALLIPECIYSYDNWGNYSEIITVLPPEATMVIIFIKFYLLIGEKNWVSKVVDQIQNDWKLFNEIPAMRKVMHEFAKRGYNFTLFYSYYILSIAVVYTGAAFVPVVMDVILPLNETRERTPSYPANYGVDSQKYFIPISIHGFITTVVALIYVFTADSFVMITVYHCSTLFNIVGILLEQLNSKNDEKYEKKIITQAIVIHKYAISFAEFIEQSVTKVYGISFLINLVAMSITGFYAVLIFKESKYDAWRMALFTLTEIVHLFFNTIPSQQLINNSEKLFNAVYNCEWNNLSIKSKNSLCIMLIRSSKSAGLTAGKFYPINMENFSNIMKTSMSYFTVLNSMQ